MITIYDRQYFVKKVTFPIERMLEVERLRTILPGNVK